MDKSSEKLLGLLDEAKEQSVSLLGLLSLFLPWLSGEEELVLLLSLASERGGLSDEETAALLVSLWALLVPNNATSKPGKLTLDLSVKGCDAGGAFAGLAPAADLPDNSLRLADLLLRRDDCAPDGPTCTADFSGLP